MRIVALHFVVNNEMFKRYGRKEEAEPQCTAIYNSLYIELNDAYRNLFMWAVVVPEELIDHAREEAFKWYLNSRKSIMQHLDMDHLYPGSFNGVLEEQFRKALKEEMERGFSLRVKRIRRDIEKKGDQT